MKKSTLLSLLTAGAVIATSAGTFAAWDTTSASVNQTLTLDKPVTVTATNLNVSRTSTVDGTTLPKYTGTAKVNVSNLPNTVSTDNYEIVYTPTVVEADSNDPITTDDIEVKAVDDGANASLAGEHTVNVEVMVKDTDAAKKLANDGTEIKVTVEAVLQSK